MRRLCGMEVLDHTKGETRRISAIESLKRADEYESDLYHKLHAKYHDISGTTTYVIREFAYQQYVEDGDWYKNIKSDVAIDDRQKQHITLIDFFYAKDMHSYEGSVRFKKNKIKKNPVQLFNSTHECVLVCVNPKISRDMMRVIKEDGFTLLSHDEFTERFLETPPKKITPNFFTKGDNSLLVK